MQTEHKILTALRTDLQKAFQGEDWQATAESAAQLAKSKLTEDFSATAIDILALPGLIAEERQKRALACWNACAGIDTAHLWPGAMVEMRDMLAGYCAELEGRSLWTSPAKKQAHADEVRAIHAKLGKV